jgi:hypothetical protein
MPRSPTWGARYFIWMDLQPEFRQPFPELTEEPIRVLAVLETPAAQTPPAAGRQ